MKYSPQEIFYLNLGILLLFLEDRLMKWLSLNYFPREGFFIIPNFFKIKLFFNPGIAFSLPLNEYLIYFLIFAILIILFYFLIQSYSQKNLFLIFILTLIIVGSFSNLIDRLRYGYVIDFLQFWILPIFNLADLMIIIPVVFLAVRNLKAR